MFYSYRHRLGLCQKLIRTCNSHIKVLNDARNYSFSQVPYLEHEEREN